jgi:hypothetical protein
MTNSDECHQATQPEAGRSGRQPDEPPQLQRYRSVDDEVVICNPEKPLEWIAANPTDVVEVDDDG